MQGRKPQGGGTERKARGRGKWGKGLRGRKCEGGVERKACAHSVADIGKLGSLCAGLIR